MSKGYLVVGRGCLFFTLETIFQQLFVMVNLLLLLSIQNVLISIYPSYFAAVCVPWVTSPERQQTQTEHSTTIRALLASWELTLKHSDTDFIIDQKIVLLYNKMT